MSDQSSNIMINNPCPGVIHGPASVALSTLKQKWETGKPKKIQKQWIERTTTLHSRYAAYEEVYFSMHGRFWASFRTEIFKLETTDGRGRFLLLTIDMSNKEGNEKPSISTCYINGPHSVEEILGSYLYSQIYDEDVAVNERRPINSRSPAKSTNAAILPAKSARAIDNSDSEVMRILPIGDTAKHKYQGSGHAVVAIAGSQIVDIVYLSSIFPDLDESDDAQIEAAIVDDRTGPVVRYLSALGDVAVGMCSCYEFLER